MVVTPNAAYHIFIRVNDKGKDYLPQLFDSGTYQGWSVYYLNDVQHSLPEMPLPKGYKLLQRPSPDDE
jgi:hypothetical protein